LSGKTEREVARGFNTILDYLEELRAIRPSVRLAANRSPKGGQTIASILAAARTVFIRDGHGGFSLRKVAEEADIAVGNVSYYFPARSELLRAMLLEELADYVEEHIEHISTESESPLEILLDIVIFYVVNGRQSHRFFFQLWGYAASDDEARSLIRDLYRPMGRFIRYLVKACRPDLPESRIRQIVLQIFSLEEGLKLFIGMGPDDDPALRTAERDVRDLTRRLIETA
jgi:AcrR family transcriptional regulator